MYITVEPLQRSPRSNELFFFFTSVIVKYKALYNATLASEGNRCLVRFNKPIL